MFCLDARVLLVSDARQTPIPPGAAQLSARTKVGRRQGQGGASETHVKGVDRNNAAAEQFGPKHPAAHLPINRCGSISVT